MAARPDLATTGFALTSSARAGADPCLPEADPEIGSNGLDPDPSQWPVLVTGAGGFVGGHVARDLARAGHRVRGLARRSPGSERGDPSIEWLIGDLADPEVRRRAMQGVRAVIHSAGWVSLGPDRLGISHASNVELTSRLLDEAPRAGVERFVYTSTLYTLAAGTSDRFADEFTPWNLERVDSAYTKTKREAERLVLAASSGGFTTIALCPGMVLGARDPKPTSTRIVRAYSRAMVAVAPLGGIPIVDATVLALAHRRALCAGGAGERYAVVGPYLSYRELAVLVSSITGRPRWLITLSDRLEPLVVPAAGWLGPLTRRWWPDMSRELAAGAFVRLRVRGDRANACFGLEHPPARDTIAKSL